MAYRLHIAAGDHQATVAFLLETFREQGPDLTLLPEDGVPITTHSLTLCLYFPLPKEAAGLPASLPPLFVCTGPLLFPPSPPKAPLSGPGDGPGQAGAGAGAGGGQGDGHLPG